MEPSSILPQSIALIDQFDVFLQKSTGKTSVHIRDEFAAEYEKYSTHVPSNLVRLCAKMADRITKEDNGTLTPARVKDLSAVLAISEIVEIDPEITPIIDSRLVKNKKVLNEINQDLKEACEKKLLEDEAAQKAENRTATIKTASALGIGFLSVLACGTFPVVAPFIGGAGILYAGYSLIPSSVSPEVQKIMKALDREFPVSDSDSEEPLQVIVEEQNPAPAAAAAAVPEPSQSQAPSMDLEQFRASLEDKSLEDEINCLAINENFENEVVRIVSRRQSLDLGLISAKSDAAAGAQISAEERYKTTLVLKRDAEIYRIATKKIVTQARDSGEESAVSETKGKILAQKALECATQARAAASLIQDKKLLRPAALSANTAIDAASIACKDAGMTDAKIPFKLSIAGPKPRPQLRIQG